MNVKRIAALTALPLVASTVMIAGGSPAFASGGGGHEASGSCSGGSTWKLKAKPDDGQMEVELEIDSNVSGQVWNNKITDNGKKVFKGKRTTGGASGSFSFEIRVPDLAGTDNFKGKSVNKATGETCNSAVSF